MLKTASVVGLAVDLANKKLAQYSEKIQVKDQYKKKTL